jgi:apolipoprotein N-acyltransferase
LKKIARKQLYLFSILTGVLLWAGWPANGFPLILLIAFCPLLIVEQQLYNNMALKGWQSFFGYSYFSMIFFNTLTTWWVCNSTYVGGIIAIACNSFFMAIILSLFHITKRRAGAIAGYFSLPVYWLAFEYIHLNWQLSWPWLTLGFGFSNYPSLLQWYRFTGPLGGTLWIFICNIAVFRIIQIKWLDTKQFKTISTKNTLLAILVFILPVLFSLFSYYSFSENRNSTPVKIVVVQPNIDPYNEKFSGNFQEQLNKMFILADTKVDNTTAYLVFPETALTDSEIWENNFLENTSIRMVMEYMKKHPNMSLITGAETYKAYLNGEKPPESARKFDSENGYYDAYNTALQLDTSKKIQVYHKCKLVPGVEFMPFSKFLAPLAKLAFDLGGTSGTLGTQKEPSVFYSSYFKTTVAPVICYESIYGEYLGQYIKKGAQMIFIITNDGWWKNTPGYKQHLCYGAMLAAETGKEVIQCANTGISASIDEQGRILQKTNWWEPAVFITALYPNNIQTFYVQHGDYLGRYSIVLSILLLVFITIRKLTTIFTKRIPNPGGNG